jgi:transglutaminase-like putative cysteine protease
VTTWCRAQALGAAPLEAARALALAARPKIDAERAGGPPSALAAVQLGGGDESGAALVVACLRALSHPARVVTGIVGEHAAAVDEGKVKESEKEKEDRHREVAPTPRWRTWAQVHDGARWIDVDPLDVDLEGRAARDHTAIVEGFPGPLTTGLVATLPVR